VPPEVSWFNIKRGERDNRVKSEMLPLDDVKVVVNAAVIGS